MVSERHHLDDDCWSGKKTLYKENWFQNFMYRKIFKNGWKWFTCMANLQLMSVSLMIFLAKELRFSIPNSMVIFSYCSTLQLFLTYKSLWCFNELKSEKVTEVQLKLVCLKLSNELLRACLTCEMTENWPHYQLKLISPRNGSLYV